MENIEHRTSNVERQMFAGMRGVFYSMFGVRCSAFDVAFVLPS
jgi:hypothetical protein